MASLEGEWAALLQEAAVASVFAGYEWQRIWWRFHNQGRSLRLLVAVAGGAVVGILPLYVGTTTYVRVPVRFLRLLGSRGSTKADYLGPLLARGREAEACRALADAVLRMPDWDVLALDDMDPRSGFPDAMARAARGVGIDCRTGRSERIAILDLPPTWDDYLRSLSGNRRYQLRNQRKRIAAAHRARFHVWTDPATLDQGIDRLGELHRKRWQQAGEDRYGFSTPVYIAFHRAVMKAFLARDQLRLYCLDFDDQTVAMVYFYRFRDEIFLFQSGFDPDHAELKPGHALLGHIIEHAIGEGIKVLDFLRGEYRHKDDLATGDRETVYVTAFRARPATWIYRARGIYVPELKEKLKQRVKQVLHRVGLRREPAAADQKR